MRYCNCCKVAVMGKRKFCPLCENELTDQAAGIPEDSVTVRVASMNGDSERYPLIPSVYRAHNMFLRILSFISVVLIVIGFTLNRLISPDYWWSLYVAGGVVCLWLAVQLAVHKRKNISKNLLYQFTLISAVCVIWDLATGFKGWSLDFVIPILCLSMMTAMLVINRIMRLKLADYMIYAILGAGFGILPVIFLCTGLIRFRIPSMLCVASSVIFLAALFIFRGEKMVPELKRRLHW